MTRKVVPFKGKADPRFTPPTPRDVRLCEAMHANHPNIDAWDQRFLRDLPDYPLWSLKQWARFHSLERTYGEANVMDFELKGEGDE